MHHARGDLAVTSAAGSFLTYEPFYGLKEKPFSLSSDPRFLYKSGTHASAYDSLRAAIRRGEGLVVLTGDVGTGKTTVCRSVLLNLDRKTVSAFVSDPFVTREELLKMLLIDFGVALSVESTIGAHRGSRLELSYPLYDFLRALVPLGTLAVIIIDEAQKLSQSMLEELRVLSDLEGPEKLLHVVLIGSRELLETLNDPRMRQLDQRVSLRCQLDPLDAASVGAYIAHRLGVAGGGRATFTADAIDLIGRASAGNPRQVNLICDRSLHYGHLIRSLGISPALVAQAMNELGMTPLMALPDPMAGFSSEASSAAGAGLSAKREVSLANDFPSESVEHPPNPDERRRFRLLSWRAVALAVLIVAAALFFAWLYTPSA